MVQVARSIAAVARIEKRMVGEQERGVERKNTRTMVSLTTAKTQFFGSSTAQAGIRRLAW